MPFQFERLLVHEKALQYSVLVAPIIDKIRFRDRDLASQLQRSSNSVPSNIGEGASEDRPKMMVDRYRTAKREAEESAINLEKAWRLGYVTRAEVEPLLALLDEIARMLFGLIKRFDGHRR
ncbi:MAG: four helix bundle protein [Gemmatimonadota bacterium]